VGEYLAEFGVVCDWHTHSRVRSVKRLSGVCRAGI
jgi:hypothetical protein